MANWFNGRKDEADKALTELEALLKEEDVDQDALIALLDEYETKFKKTSLKTILDARFLGIKASHDLNPSSVTGEGWSWTIQEALQQRMGEFSQNRWFEKDAEATQYVNEQPLITVQSGTDLTPARLLEIYLKKDPEFIGKLAVSFATNQAISDQSPANSQLAKAAIALKNTPEDITALIQSNEDLEHNMEVKVSLIHIGRIARDLQGLDIATASAERLFAAREQSKVFDQLQADFATDMSVSEVKRQEKELKAIQSGISARLIELFAESEAAKPAEQRMFWLKAPQAGQVITKLSTSELMESTETRLYRTTLGYIDTLQSFLSDKSPENLKTLQQCRFDLLRSQQDKLVAEIKGQISDSESQAVLGQNDYEKDIELLKSIHNCRQQTARYRPIDSQVNSQVSNVLHLAGNVIWKDEQTLNEILANLAHDRALKQLGYSFKAEFQAVCGDSPKHTDSNH